MYRLVSIIGLSLFVLACSSQKKYMGERKEYNSSNIIEMLNAGRHVYLDSCVIWGDLDFTTTKDKNRITDHITNVFIRSSLTFTNCVFMGKVSAYDEKTPAITTFSKNVSFVTCDFRDVVDFRESIIEGNAFFTGTVFREISRWQNTCFKHRTVYFNETNFEGDAFFQNAIFPGDANFMHARFNQSAIFQKVKTGGMFSAGNMTIGQYADFSYAKMESAIFNYSVFEGNADFSYTGFTDRVEFNNVEWRGNTSFDNAWIVAKKDIGIELK